MNWHKLPKGWKVINRPCPITNCSSAKHDDKIIYLDRKDNEGLAPDSVKVHEFAHARMNERGLAGPYTASWHEAQEFYAIGHSLNYVLRNYPDQLYSSMEVIEENAAICLSTSHHFASKRIMKTNLWKRCERKLNENSDKD